MLLNARNMKLRLQTNFTERKVMNCSRISGILKTKWWTDGISLEEVDSYVSVGRELNMAHNNQPEITHQRDGRSYQFSIE